MTILRGRVLVQVASVCIWTGTALPRTRGVQSVAANVNEKSWWGELPALTPRPDVLVEDPTDEQEPKNRKNNHPSYVFGTSLRMRPLGLSVRR